LEEQIVKKKSNHIRCLSALILIVASSWCSIGWSATITFGTTNVSGNIWTYDYSVSNNTLTSDIQEFTVFFDMGLYQNLSLAGSPVLWDSIVVQPDLQLPANGFFDSLALAGGIGVGASLSGFSVQFEYLGLGTPGAQPFDIVDPSTFLALESGVTTQVVPLPAAVWLLFSGMIPLIATAARRSRSKLPRV
jgi:hypothetical protein